MNPYESYAVFAIASTVIMSFIYFFILDRMKAGKTEKARTRIISLYAWRKIIGFLLFGVLPVVAARVFFKLNPINTLFAWGSTGDIWPWLAGACILFLSLNLFSNSRDQDLRALYPEMRLPGWNTAGILILAGGWILYFTAYEFLFRGLLLFSCYHAFGLWPAVAINLALYSALHLPKGMKEATAAIPFGALLCYLTIQSQSILPALILHSLQAISCEISCIYRNPEMNFQLSKKS